jgi:hypothetical protein
MSEIRVSGPLGDPIPLLSLARGTGMFGNVRDSQVSLVRNVVHRKKVLGF